MKNRERVNANHRAYNKRNAERLSARNKAKRAAKLAAMTPEQAAQFRKDEATYKTASDRKFKDVVFQAYGGWVCKCCGETERAFLSIDHVSNDGYKMRAVHGHSSTLYRWLRKNNFPSGFQVLCMNCNFGKRMNNGVCPHQERCNDYPSGSRAKRPEAQSARKGDDIVWSAPKGVAE